MSQTIDRLAANAVSIHAPVMDANLYVKQVSRLCDVSIHAPVMDANDAQAITKANAIVSIHAPVMDANS